MNRRQHTQDGGAGSSRASRATTSAKPCHKPNHDLASVSAPAILRSSRPSVMEGGRWTEACLRGVIAITFLSSPPVEVHGLPSPISL